MKKIVAAALLAAVFSLASLSAAADKRYVIPLTDSPALGPADARVTIVEFIDFQ
jgi:hypothetical protein